MRELSDEEVEEVMNHMERAKELAEGLGCEDANCGSVIVKDGRVIGKGHNSPPGNLESQRRCSREKDEYGDKVTDKTCCVHAEQRAIMDALGDNPDELEGSTLYFTRVDNEGEMKKSNELYCTICSKMILDVGVGEVVMWKGDDLVAYDSEEYNDLSYGK